MDRLDIAAHKLWEFLPFSRCLRSEPMSKHTTFRIGGACDLFTQPATFEEIEQIFAAAEFFSLPLFVMGQGSNVLVPDEGLSGIVLCLSDAFSAIRMDGESVFAEAGARLASLCSAAAQNGLSGLEELGGIPGRLGGALRMNAGAFGTCIGDVVESVTVLREGKTQELSREACSFSYRSTGFLKSDVILGARLKLRKEQKERIASRIRSAQEARVRTQPLSLPSAGSVFRRAERPAGELVEKVGLKGMKIGNAQISEKHANFIVNLGGATAKDVRALIELAKLRVFEESGVQLKEEIVLLGG